MSPTAELPSASQSKASGYWQSWHVDSENELAMICIVYSCAKTCLLFVCCCLIPDLLDLDLETRCPLLAAICCLRITALPFSILPFWVCVSSALFSILLYLLYLKCVLIFFFAKWIVLLLSPCEFCPYLFLLPVNCVFSSHSASGVICFPFVGSVSPSLLLSLCKCCPWVMPCVCMSVCVSPSLAFVFVV